MNKYTPWRDQLGEGLTGLQNSLRPAYEDVEHVRAYSSWLVPGMLQTRGYIEAIFASIQRERGLTDNDIEAAVEARLGRQPLMHRGSQNYEFLIEESSLRNGVGGVEAMRPQLRFLAELIEPGDVSVSGGDITIGVLPIGVNRKRWPEASFWIFDDNRVNIELVSGSVDLDDRADVTEYENRFAQLAADAVYGTMARSLVLAIAESLGVA